MLQIAIHGDDVLATGIVESGSERRCLAKVAAKFYHHHAAIDGGYLLQVDEGLVAATVVDKDHFEGLVGSFHHVFQAVIELGDVLFLVVKRHNDGEAYRRVGLFNAHGNRGQLYPASKHGQPWRTSADTRWARRQMAEAPCYDGIWGPVAQMDSAPVS